ncbi:MAG TPA: hypothetical protein PK649_05635 [Vicingus sp.]|nr:hypothetical protein [Vicingus sp.]HRP59758.1 hypothetical protein [Vicingus sp.]
MKNLFIILIVLIVALNGFGQNKQIIGQYSNSFKTELVIKSDSTFIISKSTLQGCVVTVNTSAGKIKTHNNIFDFIPNDDLKSSELFEFNSKSDTLSSDSIYIQLNSMYNKEQIISYGIVTFYSKENQIILNSTTNEVGFGRYKKLDFSYIKISYILFSDVIIFNEDIEGNMITVELVKGSDKKLLNGNLSFIQKSNGNLKVLNDFENKSIFKKLK